MLLKEDIRKVALEKAVELNGYIVDITVSNTNVITIYFDRDSGVHVDDCLAISRHIHDNFDRDDEDYELTVCSPGLTNPLKIKEQYLKHQGQEVVVKKRDGKKISGLLKEYNDNITLEVLKKDKGNNKQYTLNDVMIPFEEIKETKLKINFK
ncbi:MAG: ribosome assembly cofactor RimP [Flavobacteriales bacterium]|nr:ribosome assembly cofactor RimP [Flavobacteriales bacterium]